MRPPPGPVRQDSQAVRARRPARHSFTRGLDLDSQAATAALTLLHHNGRTEGVNTKTILWNLMCQAIQGNCWAG
jgi:hypothetical protein